MLVDVEMAVEMVPVLGAVVSAVTVEEMAVADRPIVTDHLIEVVSVETAVVEELEDKVLEITVELLDVHPTLMDLRVVVLGMETPVLARNNLRTRMDLQLAVEILLDLVDKEEEMVTEEEGLPVVMEHLDKVTVVREDRVLEATGVEDLPIAMEHLETVTVAEEDRDPTVTEVEDHRAVMELLAMVTVVEEDKEDKEDKVSMVTELEDLPAHMVHQELVTVTVVEDLRTVMMHQEVAMVMGQEDLRAVMVHQELVMAMVKETDPVETTRLDPTEVEVHRIVTVLRQLERLKITVSVEVPVIHPEDLVAMMVEMDLAMVAMEGQKVTVVVDLEGRRKRAP